MITKLLSVVVFSIALSNICLSASISDSTETNCVARDYGKGSIVCVCNADYCDTLPAVEKPDSLSTYIKYTSSKEGSRFTKETDVFKDYVPSEVTSDFIYVDTTKEYQEILGWGGAFSDATGFNIDGMSEGTQQQILRSYFGEGSIDYNLCRVPMAGTDFSTHPYSYLEDEDHTLSNFSLAEEDFKYKIPFIQQAMDLSNNSLKLFASPWIAPRWMKTMPFYAGMGTIKEEFYPQWAQYFKKFLDHYQENGIEFWGITTGNEPSLATMLIQGTPTVGWTPTAMNNFIRDYLGPTLKTNYPDIKIMALDDQRGYLPDLETILNGTEVSSYVDGIAVHWYQDLEKPPVLLNDARDTFPDKFLLATEACTGSTIQDALSNTHVIMGSWERAERYAYDIIENINHWVTGWVSWNMVLNLIGGPTYTFNFVDAEIIINQLADEFYKQPMYYAHGHFSKFIPRGSKRIDISGTVNTNSSVAMSAFKRPDDGIVLVVLNSVNTTTPLNIVHEKQQISELLSPNSITTYVYWI